MPEQGSGLERPIRVVVFGGGPSMELGARQFISRLEESSEIEFLGAFCQSRGQGYRAVVEDTWRRRRLVTIPLLLAEVVGSAGRLIAAPQRDAALRRSMARVASRVHFVADIHGEQVLDQVRALAPDLGLIYGSPILKPRLFEIPRYGTLGIHHGKMPEYRGKKTTFWAIYNGEATAGVTIQRVNAGLDLGEIVKQGAVVIDRRSPRQVWTELEALGVELYVEAILQVKRGSARYQPCAGRKGRLYPDPTPRDLLRFWRREAGRLLR